MILKYTLFRISFILLHVIKSEHPIKKSIDILMKRIYNEILQTTTQDEEKTIEGFMKLKNISQLYIQGLNSSIFNIEYMYYKTKTDPPSLNKIRYQDLLKRLQTK